MAARRSTSHPLAALFGNTYLWHELVHMYTAGYIVTGFLIAACYAFGRLRGRWGRYERTALAIPLTIACSPPRSRSSSATGPAARWPSTSRRSSRRSRASDRRPKGADVHILGWYTNGKVKFGIPIPHGLSVLAFHSWNATVQGLDAVPQPDRPPVNLVRFAFQTMVGIGTLLALLGVIFLVVRVRRRRLPISRWFYRAVVLAGPASLVALIAGWVTTEVGRQPWVVYHVMRTSQAVTGAGGLPVGYATLALAYVGVAIGVVWILRRLAAAPLECRIPAPPTPAASADPRPSRRERELMHLYEIPLIFALVGLVLYTVLGGADFGAGIWQLTAGNGEFSERIRDHAHDSMAPVWEANHVWLVFVLVVFWTAYPAAFGSIASTLSIPLFLAGIGIVLRGASYALRCGTRTPRELRVIDTVFAISSLLMPFALGATVGGIASRARAGRQRRRRSVHELVQRDRRS